MRIRVCKGRKGLASALTFAALALLVATAAACGGAATSTGAGTTPQTSPSVATTPERLEGSDSIAVTQRLVDAERAVFQAPTAAKFGRFYARDALIEDLTVGISGDKAAGIEALRQNLREYSGVRMTAGYAGQGWAAIEQRWDFTKTYKATLQILAVQETRGGKVARETLYYQAMDDLPGGTPLEPKPLTSAAGPADTPAAAADVALKYAMALQAKDAAALAALSAPNVTFLDIASSTVGSSPGDVQARYAEMFSQGVRGLAFTQVRYAFGAGWAAVMWTTAIYQSPFGKGVTVLEIRDGKIARETLYYNSTDVPF